MVEGGWHRDGSDSGDIDLVIRGYTFWIDVEEAVLGRRNSASLAARH